MTSARVIIEGLRSGIPYRETAQAITIGREGSLRALTSLMDTVSHGRRPNAFGQVIRAQYGEGKTHLMHAMAHQAWDANWVVSMLSISKETPLDRLDHLYPKLVSNTYRPGSKQAGLDAIITESLAEPHLLAESRAVDLTERTRTVLDNLARQNAGTAELLADVSGQFLTLAELKRIHRENFHKLLKIPSTRIQEEIPAYLILVDWLIARAGYEGWLILIDEVEVLGKFGRGGRARSYANMGRFLTGLGDRTISVWAVAGNFQTDVLVERHDMEQIPQWLSARPREAASADWARIALEELATARPLPSPTTAEIRELMRRIYELHQDAYHWTVPVTHDRFYDMVRENVGTLDARLRTWVRLALGLLDLWFQYGVDGIEVRAEFIEDVDLSEDDEVERDGEADGQVILRPRLFE